MIYVLSNVFTCTQWSYWKTILFFLTHFRYNPSCSSYSYCLIMQIHRDITVLFPYYCISRAILFAIKNNSYNKKINYQNINNIFLNSTKIIHRSKCIHIYKVWHDIKNRIYNLLFFRKNLDYISYLYMSSYIWYNILLNVVFFSLNNIFISSHYNHIIITNLIIFIV